MMFEINEAQKKDFLDTSKININKELIDRDAKLFIPIVFICVFVPSFSVYKLIPFLFCSILSCRAFKKISNKSKINAIDKFLYLAIYSLGLFFATITIGTHTLVKYSSEVSIIIISIVFFVLLVLIYLLKLYIDIRNKSFFNLISEDEKLLKTSVWYAGGIVLILFGRISLQSDVFFVFWAEVMLITAIKSLDGMKNFTKCYYIKKYKLEEDIIQMGK